jgi:hypothetical protein
LRIITEGTPDEECRNGVSSALPGQRARGSREDRSKEGGSEEDAHGKAMAQRIAFLHFGCPEGAGGFMTWLACVAGR